MENKQDHSNKNENESIMSAQEVMATVRNLRKQAQHPEFALGSVSEVHGDSMPGTHEA